MLYKNKHLDQSYPEASHGSNWYSTTKEKKEDINLAKICTRCDVRYWQKKNTAILGILTTALILENCVKKMPYAKKNEQKYCSAVFSGKLKLRGWNMSDCNTADPVIKHKYLALWIYPSIYSKVFGEVLLQCWRLIKVMWTLNPHLQPYANPTGPWHLFTCFWGPPRAPGAQRGVSYLPVAWKANHSWDGV